MYELVGGVRQSVVELLRRAAALREVGSAAPFSTQEGQRFPEQGAHRGPLGALRTREYQLCASVFDGREERSPAFLCKALRNGPGESCAAANLRDDRRGLRFQPERFELGELLEQSFRRFPSGL